MKRTILCLSFLLCSVTLYANVPANHPKLAEYFTKRFVRLHDGGAQYDIDFKEVQSVLYDNHGYISAKHSASGFVDWGKQKMWVFFKNGSWIVLDPSAAPQNSWDGFKTFLKNNPQFLTIP